MSFSVGIVGLPNVGKSTLFKAITKKNILIANYPFATIDPNVGIVEVPDERLAQLARVSKSEKIIPTTIEFYDIAGLVAGAHKGEGLGNQFLSHIREVDAIVHVVRVFVDPNIVHVHGAPNPRADIEVIHLELIMADLKTVEKRMADAQAKARSGDKEAARMLSVTTNLKSHLEAGKLLSQVDLTDEEIVESKLMSLLTIKPMLFAFNVEESAANTVATVEGVPPEQAITLCAQVEAELSDLSPADAREFMADLGIATSGLDRLVALAYSALGLITYITSGEMETRAWTIPRGTKAPAAAGVIHTDFEKTFIRAEVINWKDFVECDGETGAKEKGLMRLEGKDYVMQDGDVCHFRVGA